MPKVSAKRQITIPVDLCQEANINPGDDIEAYIYNEQITLVKKEKGAAKGILSQIKTDKRFSDKQSLSSAIEDKHKGAA